MSADAQGHEFETLRKSIAFALQCNATLGTIEDVVVTGVVSAHPGFQTVRGTYHQKVGGVSAFMMRSADTLGGVFEGEYDVAAARLRSLQFKISVRTGSVVDGCLR